MMAEIRTTQLNLEIADVGDVVVTTTEQDPELGDYVRDIRIFGVPATSGGSAPLLVQLRIRSASRANLDLSAPAQEF
jgi:hypothetical protein